jgi:predicted N-acetyltransferase YhbS
VQISYSVEQNLKPAEFIDVLRRSTLAERRPVDDLPRIERMLAHANLVVCARDGDVLVGVARALTDFSFCCYLSDLAVDHAYQRQGIGKELIAQVQEASGEEAMVLLLAAPAALEYYGHIGMEKVDNGWILQRRR